MSPSTSKYKYAVGLHRNARAFVESAIDYARKDYEDYWKFAILHLTTALELLLKARLALEDHKHLVVGKDQISERQFDEGDFKSVGIEECIERLNRIGGFFLNGHQLQVLKTLRKLRNRVAHYSDLNGDTTALKACAAAGLNLFIEIDSAEFRDEDPYGARTMRQLVVDLHKYDDFVKERLSSLCGRLHSAVRPRTHHTDECGHCLQDATIIINDEVQCLFCGDRMTVQEFTESRSGDGTVETCPACGRPSVGKYEISDRESTYECFICGYFRGPEQKWSDGKIEIPRLHDRT